MILSIVICALGATENSTGNASQIALLIFIVTVFVTAAVLILQNQRSGPGAMKGGGGAT